MRLYNKVLDLQANLAKKKVIKFNPKKKDESEYEMLIVLDLHPLPIWDHMIEEPDHLLTTLYLISHHLHGCISGTYKFDSTHYHKKQRDLRDLIRFMLYN